jgi:hypothetical protein
MKKQRDALKAKEGAFRLALGNENAKTVLADLRVFCHATKSTFSDNPLEMARLEGRREVFNRIMNFLKINYSDYYNYEEEEPYE